MESLSKEIKVVYFVNDDGSEPAKDFIDKLKKKKKFVEHSKVTTRINRAGQGNFGDHRFVAGNLLELKIDYGPGYRVYCGVDGEVLILVLGAGTKKDQQLDIEQAKERWSLYKQEKKKIDESKGNEDGK